jgi:serine protease Do
MRRLIAAALVSAAPMPASAGPYSDAGPAVVQIHVYGTLRAPNGARSDYDDYGTGFLVSPEGLILTAGHLVPNAENFMPGELWIEARLPIRSEQAITAGGPTVGLEVLSSMTSPHDVALMRIREARGPYPYLRLCDHYGAEDSLTVLGYTGGGSALSRTVGSVKTPATTVTPLVMQMPLSGGDSGGPVFNSSGTVFGVALGGQTINNERISSTTLAEMMPIAISALSPSARALIGVSYDPDCTRVLTPLVATIPFEQLITANVTLMGDGSSAFVRQRVEAPAGYLFRQITQASAQFTTPAWGGASATPTARIVGNGQSVDFLVQASDSGSRYAAVTLPIELNLRALLVPIGRAPVLAQQEPEAEVRSFSISNTLEDHQLGNTRRAFIEEIPAPRGMRFLSVLSVSNQSLNHSPSNGAEVAISGDGASLRISYELESGPAWDRWRGWIDAIIVARLEPVRPN